MAWLDRFCKWGGEPFCRPLPPPPFLNLDSGAPIEEARFLTDSNHPCDGRHLEPYEVPYGIFVDEADVDGVAEAPEPPERRRLLRK